MAGKMSRNVPPEVWEPIADRIAAEYGVTRKGMLFHGQAAMFFVPRAKFWRELKALPENYGLSAIARISGHNHTTIISAFESPNADKAPGQINRPCKKIGTLVGRVYGTLAVIAHTGFRDGSKARMWRCHCAVCKKDCEKSTAALGQGSECPTCKSTTYRHRIEQATLHRQARRAPAYG